MNIMDVERSSAEPPSKRIRISGLDGADEIDEHHSSDLRSNEPKDPVPAESKKQETGTMADQIQKEINAGITILTNPDAPGFQGILKQRYTDFLVNEVLPNGEVLHLTNLRAPSRKATNSESSQNETVASTAADGAKNEQVDGRDSEPGTNQKDDSEYATDFVLSETDRTSLQNIIDEKTVSAVVELYKSILKHHHWQPKRFEPVSSEPIESREARTALHQAVRRIFNSRIETQTRQENVITFLAAPKVAKGPRQGGPRQGGVHKKGALAWDDLGGEHLHFTLYKENKDTMEAMYFLASQLKTAVKTFQFAGTKDRRAVTVQRVSAYRVQAHALEGIGRRLRGSKIGDFQHQPTGLELGQTDGNEFVITLRDCHFDGEEDLSFDDKVKRADDIVQQSLRSFEKGGFINYYGLQRFGSFTTGTDVVGTKMLQGNYKGAVDAILDFNPDTLEAALNQGERPSNDKISADDLSRAMAINIWKTEQDSRKAIQKLPRKFSAESTIIQQLGSKDRQGRLHQVTNYAGALGVIPRNLRLMYVHAYQSLVWNHLASERWKLYGDRVVEGDLVIIEKEPVKQDEVDEVGEAIIHPDPAELDRFERARPLSASEVESGKYSMTDIVLPLPGFDVIYPPNAVGEAYKTFMASERGGGLDPYSMRRDWKELSLSGGYRKLIAKPAPGMTAEVKVYDRDEEQLVETDMDRLRAKTDSMHLNGMNGRGDQKQEPVFIEAEGMEGQNRKIAVVIKMQLGSSQYATMALRELMGVGGVKTYKPDFGGGR